MGSFSWLRADKTTKRNNLVDGDVYKILIPQEFGGGYIKDTYFDYGQVFEYDDTKENADLYGILAYWNKCEGMIFDGDEYPSTMQDILERGHTCYQENRCKGINIGCSYFLIIYFSSKISITNSSTSSNPTSYLIHL